MRKFVVPALAALSFAGVASAPASAEEVTRQVALSDFDVVAVSEAGLAERIDAAVKTACARPSIRDLEVRQAWENCEAVGDRAADQMLDESFSVASI